MDAPADAVGPAEARRAAALAATGAWTAAVPYLGRALGLGVAVAPRVEVVDHVVPGAVVAATAAWMAWLARRAPLAGRAPGLVGGGICFLAGFWVLATHVPLLADAARGSERWGAALWHASAALPLLVLSLWVLLAPGREERD